MKVIKKVIKLNLSDTEYQSVLDTAQAERRTVPAQIMHWLSTIDQFKPKPRGQF